MRTFISILGLSLSLGWIGCGDGDSSESPSGTAGSGGSAAGAAGAAGSGGSAAGSGGSAAGAGGSAAGAAGNPAAGAAGGVGPTSPLVDPGCTDGKYTETLPDPNASIAGFSYTGDIAAYVDQLLGARYPWGGELVKGGRLNTKFGDCSVLFAGAVKDGSDVIKSLEVIVHECGHIYDGELSKPPENVYAINKDLKIACSRGDSVKRGGDTFERSRLNNDAYAKLRPRCSSGQSPCDSYADIYLDGDPDDAKFEGGDQGFNLLFEEQVQYVNSLANQYAFADQLKPNSSTSARDGILTFLWYVERYLHMARLEYPKAYERIADDPCWRDAILTNWGRAWLYLDLTKSNPQLGIKDAEIEALVMDKDLLEEIQRLRDKASCK